MSIDSIAGPSEILILADETANPRYVAADLLSQAEHDELASAILITTSEKLAEQVQKEVEGFCRNWKGQRSYRNLWKTMVISFWQIRWRTESERQMRSPVNIWKF